MSITSLRHPLRDRRDDLYETPAEAVHALLRVESFPEIVWEPACGPGAIVQVLRNVGHKVYATDLVDHGCPDSESRVDFLMEHGAPTYIGAIVTNPPFKLAAAFVAHALLLGIPKVALLLRLAFYEAGTGQARAHKLRHRVLDEIPPARIHVFRKRLPMMHRHGWTGNRVSNPTAFAWFVWDREHRGPTELDRISWEQP